MSFNEQDIQDLKYLATQFRIVVLNNLDSYELDCVGFNDPNYFYHWKQHNISRGHIIVDMTPVNDIISATKWSDVISIDEAKRLLEQKAFW
jgi:hypothetical protein